MFDIFKVVSVSDFPHHLKLQVAPASETAHFTLTRNGTVELFWKRGG